MIVFAMWANSIMYVNPMFAVKNMNISHVLYWTHMKMNNKTLQWIPTHGILYFFGNANGNI